MSADNDAQQPELWDTSELERLAHLRQLAASSSAPDEVRRVIDRAATAVEAMDLLSEAGLMPADTDPVEVLLTWFTPLLEPDCDQLTAEVVGAEFVASLRRNSPSESVVAMLLRTVLGSLPGTRSAEAVAMTRVLTVVGPDDVKPVAAAAAAKLVAAGMPDPPWAANLGAPVPGACFGYEDIYGEQRSLAMTFSYGRKKHALVVLVDYILGGGIKDCFFTQEVTGLKNEYRAIGRQDYLEFRDFDSARARAILDEALSRQPCPVEDDQVDSVDELLDLVRARVALLPLPAQAGQAETVKAGKPGAAAKAGAATKGTAGPKNIHRIKVTLRGSKPPIWRRFEVPSDITLKRLHDVIQLGFGWQDCHLFVFETAAGQYGVPDPDSDCRSAANKKLSAVADWPDDRIRYEYDFGDSWEHEILVEAVLPAEPGIRYPRCLTGRRACPPEDCGGLWGYYELLNVLANRRSPQHRVMLEWLRIESPAEFDPDHFSAAEANAELSQISKVLIRR